MALPSKGIAIKDAIGPSGAYQTMIQNKGQEAGDLAKAGGRTCEAGGRTGPWVCSCLPLSKCIIINNNRIITTPVIYSALNMPPLEGGECNYLHFSDEIRKLRTGGQVTCLGRVDHGDETQDQLHPIPKSRLTITPL